MSGPAHPGEKPRDPTRPGPGRPSSKDPGAVDQGEPRVVRPFIVETPDSKTYNLHAGQEKIMRSTARFTVACAGTGGGKTCIGPLWVAQKVASLGRPCIGMVVAPTFPIMSRATAPTLVSTLKGTPLEGQHVGNQYRLPNGLGIIYLLSADNEDGLEGGQVDFVWIDEGGQITKKAWDALVARTGVKESPILVTTTPYAFNWLKEINDKFIRGDKQYLVVTWRSIDNPAYPKAEYDAAKTRMSASRFAMRYDGQFARSEGLVYPDLRLCEVDHVPPPAGVLVGGIDFGFNDPFVALGAVYYVDTHGDDILYVYYERYKRNETVEQHAAKLPVHTLWFADPSRPDSILSLRRAYHRCKPAKNAVMDGIEKVTSRILAGKLKISSRCIALLSEGDEYHYPDKDTTNEKPVDEFNHAMDALRYLISGVDVRKRTRTSEPLTEVAT